MKDRVDVILGPDVGKVWVTIRKGNREERLEITNTSEGLLGMADAFIRAARMTIRAEN